MSEAYWYNVLTFDERVHYEKCIHAIMHFYHGDRYELSFFMTKAKWHAITNPLIAAIVWRIREELSND